eukprot:2221165-Rhodomonas_salina.1
MLGTSKDLPQPLFVQLVPRRVQPLSVPGDCGVERGGFVGNLPARDPGENELALPGAVGACKCICKPRVGRKVDPAPVEGELEVAVLGAQAIGQQLRQRVAVSDAVPQPPLVALGLELHPVLSVPPIPPRHQLPLRKVHPVQIHVAVELDRRHCRSRNDCLQSCFHASVVVVRVRHLDQPARRSGVESALQPVPRQRKVAWVLNMLSDHPHALHHGPYRRSVRRRICAARSLQPCEVCRTLLVHRRCRPRHLLLANQRRVNGISVAVQMVPRPLPRHQEENNTPEAPHIRWLARLPHPRLGRQPFTRANNRA